MIEIPEKLFEDIMVTMRHARVFITSREKMHFTGVRLLDELVSSLEEIAGTPSIK